MLQLWQQAVIIDEVCKKNPFSVALKLQYRSVNKGEIVKNENVYYAFPPQQN